MPRSVQYAIFRKGSTTYFHASLFFPEAVRNDVFSLYAFVRQADDYVDSTPQQQDEFEDFCERWWGAAGGTPAGDVVIDGFAELASRKGFDLAWVDAFLASMRSDLFKNRYETHQELDQYLYGSAEVIGLMMAQVLDLPEESHPSAQVLGRAMQYINFIRDIDEDLALGRVYFPQADIRRYGLHGLERADALEAPDQFSLFIRDRIAQYRLWQAEGEQGYGFIPYRYLIPIRTAAEMYRWTATTIEANPMIIYEQKVRPSVSRIISAILSSSLRIPLSRVHPRQVG